MSQLIRIEFNGFEAKAAVYTSNVEDFPELCRKAGNAANALVADEDPKPACAGHVAAAAAPAGFQANGELIARLGALVQKAIAKAPALIAEIQTLAPEITALIALFGNTPATAA